MVKLNQRYYLLTDFFGQKLDIIHPFFYFCCWVILRQKIIRTTTKPVNKSVIQKPKKCEVRDLNPRFPPFEGAICSTGPHKLKVLPRVVVCQ
jgi:hypothetical protein